MYLGAECIWVLNVYQKLECANYSCKCYRAGLEKLVQEKPSYKGRGGLTQKMQCRLTSTAHSAIKMRSKEQDLTKAVKLLEWDLQNGPYHCFGHHDRCSPDSKSFCIINQSFLLLFMQYNMYRLETMTKWTRVHKKR